MRLSIAIDWKGIVAIGIAGGFVFLCEKMDSATAEKVSTYMIDTFGKLAFSEPEEH